VEEVVAGEEDYQLTGSNSQLQGQEIANCALVCRKEGTHSEIENAA
jgi:hypothetical protein